VIAALDSFQKSNARYPDSLPELVPSFMEAAALAVPAAAQERYPLEYTRNDSGYALRFRYVGPGMNRCTFIVPPRGWQCGGYF
jgi:hypothetical protein